MHVQSRRPWENFKTFDMTASKRPARKLVRGTTQDELVAIVLIKSQTNGTIEYQSSSNRPGFRV